MKVLKPLESDASAQYGNITYSVNVNSKKLQASVLSVSELQSNPIYISARMRICSTRVNLNKQSVTKEFIEEIVVNKANYIGMPLYADTRRLTAKDYKRLGHLYDPSSGKFYTDQIGTFVDFEVSEDEYGTSLIGEVRISKRNRDICESVIELYNAGNLKISFEVFYADFVKDDNGVTIINKSDHNHLISACIVSIPAYPEASTLALVAQKDEGLRLEKINAAEYIASEVSLDTLVLWIYEYMGMMELNNEVQIERIGPDFAILYFVRDGKTYKLDFAVSPSGLDIIALYEIEFVRKLETKGIDYMSNSEKIKDEGVLEVVETTETVVAEEANADVTNVETVDVAEVAEVTEDVVEAEAVAETLVVDGANPENDPRVEFDMATVAANITIILDMLKALSARVEVIESPAITTVETTVATASEEEVKIDAPDKGDQLQANILDAENKMRENREIMTQLAEARGFDIESEAVAKAIEALDYQELLKCENVVISAAATINGMVDDINIGGNRHPALEKS